MSSRSFKLCARKETALEGRGVAMLFPVLSCGCTLSRRIGACWEDGQKGASPVSQSLEEEQGLCDREGEDVQGQGRAAGERPE